MTWTSRVGIAVVHAYQLVLGPLLGGTCRFHPTCSAYALEAFEAHGGVRGTWLAIRRVSRCHPLGSSGYDPVPPATADPL